jgi:Family of unknown function (DUF5685)/NfeD-like C-terminal, partner-binding
MFGFLRPGCYSRHYRQIYATYCAYQRQHYGVAASLFTSYEAVFMYLVAVEAGACAWPAATTPSCCRFRSDPTNRWGIDQELAGFASAVAMLLADAKLEDDIRDSRSLMARGLRAYLRRPIERALGELDRLQEGFCDGVREQVRRHLGFENARATTTLADYAVPTGRAFEMIFQLLQKLCSRRLHREISLQTLGKAIGESILICDCVNDFRRDHLTGQFTPLRNIDQLKDAWRLGLKRLATAGWNCCDLFGEDRQTVRILGSVFRRFARRSMVESKSRVWYRSAESRRGECDCLCDGCSGCDDCFSSADCCDGCVTACDVFNCIVNGSDGRYCQGCGGWGRTSADRRDKSKASQPPPADDASITRLIGQQGQTLGDVDSIGIVELDGQIWPARTVHQSIAANRPIVVVGGNPFGLSVRIG